MSASEEPFRRKASAQVVPSTGKALVTTLLILFLLLHVLGGIILQHAGAATDAPPAQTLTLQHSD